MNLINKIFTFADNVYLFYSFKHDLVLKIYVEKYSSLKFEFARLNRPAFKAKKAKLVHFKPNPASSSDFSVYINGTILNNKSHS